MLVLANIIYSLPIGLMPLLLRNFIRYLESHEIKVIPWVINIVGLALIIDTLLELTYGVLDYKAYQFMFQWLTPPIILLRYCISVIWRCAFILALTGVCLRKEIFRKSLIVLTGLEVAILFWKHPYQAIINAHVYTHSNLAYSSYAFLLPWSSQQYYPFIISIMVELFVIDLTKAFLILSFFSYPKVRKFFK